MDTAGFFRRKRFETAGGGSRAMNGYVPAAAPNIDEFAFLPVSTGYWKQHELWDGTYNLDDLLDIVEMIRINKENQARAREVMK